MSKKASKEIDDVLDSVEALSQMAPCPFGDCAKDVLSSLAQRLEVRYENVHSWIRGRAYRPNAETFLEILHWRDAMLAKVNLNRSEKIGYRKALEKVKATRAVK